jgi:hypothetical protein
MPSLSRLIDSLTPSGDKVSGNVPEQPSLTISVCDSR